MNSERRSIRALLAATLRVCVRAPRVSPDRAAVVTLIALAGGNSKVILVPIGLRRDQADIRSEHFGGRGSFLCTRQKVAGYRSLNRNGCSGLGQIPYVRIWWEVAGEGHT
jgi:hypothetical protein